MLKTIKTAPYDDQKMGTAGLRKKSKVWEQPNYVENFVQSIFNSIGGVKGKTYIVGGDGRYFNDIVIQKIIKLAAGNGAAKLIIGQNGILSTPAASKLIIENKTDGGFILSASHNPGGPNGDAGIKYSNSSGGQAPQQVTDEIYKNTKTIAQYTIFDNGSVDLSKIGTVKYGDMKIEIVDPIKDYVKMVMGLFDFPAIQKLIKNGFKIKFDSMNAVTGPYAKKIFEEILGAEEGTVINAVPLPDFGGLHPDPNLKYAKELLDIMNGKNAPDFGAATDGDGDRYMILGSNFFVTPSDSLAVLTDNYKLIPGYKSGIFGAAKSAATSTAVSRVAKEHKIGYYETPTGWKFFVNLMDSNRITFCGEESFGAGSNHIREKDGIWAILFWLNIIAATGKSVEEIMNLHWTKYGRSYYMRFDFEEIDTKVANDLIENLKNKLPSLEGKTFGEYKIDNARSFVYNDPVDNSVTQDGYVITFSDGSRIVYRLSGTGSVGATLRIYVEKYEKSNIKEEPMKMVGGLAKIATDIAEVAARTGKEKADVMT
ncbi:MAG: alpha-D-glucose phosphate-specific phosphoglucomutase [Lactobacillaceae bacterium]|jgi:phosphoglucomutase|nr:alpha-D-glucose phosphate-specific phosphoglucomutase [Lactobacillaceae bacterium]